VGEFDLLTSAANRTSVSQPLAADTYRRAHALTSGAKKPRLGVTVIGTGDVVAGQRYGRLPVRQLDLKDRHAAAAEALFAARQVELEHAAEAFVVQRSDGVPVGGEALDWQTQSLL
jgi:hypothetical protein